MSAANTNLETQKRRHKGPLVGIGLVLGLVAVGFFLVFFSGQFLSGTDPKGTDVQIKSTMGERVDR